MRALLARARALWRTLRHSDRVDREMGAEMRFHVDMHAERLVRERGLKPEEARRQALVAFGGVEQFREKGRDVLGLTWIRGMSSDVKLGARMLVKYPGLTAIATLALSLAIGAGASYLEFVNDVFRPTLPLPAGERIVGIQSWDAETGTVEARALAQFAEWRDGLTSYDILGAVRPLNRNLITADGRSETVFGVAISASAFRMAQVPPLHGRPLLDQDEAAGAPPVAVIGHDLWQTRFAADEGVVGRTVRLGRTLVTVVGVMPPGFGFPVSQNVWVPLLSSDLGVARRGGPEIKIFGRLAEGVSIGQAQAELDARARRDAGLFPATDRHLRPVVQPYVESLLSDEADSQLQQIALYSVNLFFLGLLGVCGANVATLVFARTATRGAEISVRTALGASRGRIAGQLFFESLVLCGLAAAIGLAVASFSMRWVKDTYVMAQATPAMFWWNDELSMETCIYAGVLAVVAAVIIGVVPALKATGPGLQDQLKHAGGASSMKFGGLWTGVIMAQVAITVIFLALSGTLGWGLRVGVGAGRKPTFAAEQYLYMRVQMDDAPFGPERDDATVEEEFQRRYRASFEELTRRLEAEPGVTGVSYATRLPGTTQGEWQIQVDGIDAHAGPDGGPFVATTVVGVDLFETLRVPMAAGRGFHAADLATDRHVAVVDQTFAKLVLGGQDPIGKRVRAAADGGNQPGPWYEIVGVVKDLTTANLKRVEDAVLYRAAAPGPAFGVQMTMHVAGDVSSLAPRLRAIAATVDPSLRLTEPRTIAQAGRENLMTFSFFTRILVGIGAIALLLSTAGVYALMSFTVSRRTSEIAIRVALGADRRGIFVATFSRALVQVALGMLAGLAPAAYVVALMAPEVAGEAGVPMAMAASAGVTVFMAVVTLLACAGPARRALRIQPAEALKGAD